MRSQSPIDKPRGAPLTRPDHRERRAPATVDTLATKGDEVEEWLDLRFFRPIGARIANALYPTRVTPDHVTLVSLVIGLAAGHLFVYTSPLINALGFVLFIISDLFDSADGQLARRRGTSTRLGRALDGLSDATRFGNLGIHLAVRLVLHDAWPWPLAVGLLILAAVSHSSQSSAVDFVRHAFLSLVAGRGSELDLEPVVPPADAPWRQRLVASLYAIYGRRQARTFPKTMGLLRAQHGRPLPTPLAALYRAQARPLLRRCAWLGQNIRFIILGITAVAGWAAGLLWVSVVPMNVILLWLVAHQERAAGTLAATAVPSVPATHPAVAVGGD
jgi:hypothetical protein